MIHETANIYASATLGDQYPGLLNAEQEIIIDTIKHFFRSNT